MFIQKYIMNRNLPKLWNNIKRISSFIFILLIVTCTPLSVFSKEKVVYFTSLSWPPYSGKELWGEGVNAIVAKSAFKAMGYTLKVDFYPWARTLSYAKWNNKYTGYFPEYYAKSIEKSFIFSDPIGDSPLGFVERKDNPVAWNTLQDLKKVKRIGTVRGYVNTREFDTMAALGEIITDPVVDDITNLKKVIGGRLPLAVIDSHVMRYVLETNREFRDTKGELQFNAKTMEIKKLYLCFRKNAEGARLVNIFNEGLKRIDHKKITEDYFRGISNYEYNKNQLMK